MPRKAWIFAHGKLTGRQPVIGNRIIKINQTNLVATNSAILAIELNIDFEL